MIKKIKEISSFIFDYFGRSFLEKALITTFGMFVFFALQKVNDYLSYRNEILIRINTDYRANSVSILKYDQILQNNT